MVESGFTRVIDKAQAAKRLALPAIWDAYTANRTPANFAAYKAAYLEANPGYAFPYDHLAPVEVMS